MTALEPDDGTTLGCMVLIALALACGGVGLVVKILWSAYGPTAGYAAWAVFLLVLATWIFVCASRSSRGSR